MIRISIIILNLVFKIPFVLTVCFNTNCPFGEVKENNNCIECGLIQMEPNVRLVGGIEAIPNSFPSQVFITKTFIGMVKFVKGGNQIEKFVNRTIRCGGTLINRYTVITAGLCTQKNLITDEYNAPVQLDPTIFPTFESAFKVYLGAHDLSKPESIVIATVSKIIQHPDFVITPESFVYNDISLLILSEPVELTPEIQLACLPNEKSSTYPEANSTVYLSGWGITSNNIISDNMPISNVLYNVKLNVYESKICADIGYKGDWSQLICGGDIIGNKDRCWGDLGGGIYIDTIIGNKLKRVIVGVTSIGDYDCGNKTPAMYARVSYFLDWITNNWKLN